MKGRKKLLAALLSFAAGVVHCLSTTVKTTARKRLKKSSYVHRQDLGTHQHVEMHSPEDLQELIQKCSRRQYGSANYRKGWQHFLHSSTNAVQRELAFNLPHPVHREEFENLAFRLGVAADTGEMPSFSDAGARSGYALDFFCRARNLADFLFDRDHASFPAFWTGALQESALLMQQQVPNTGQPLLRMASIGGGPGYDFVAAALVAMFASSGNDQARRQPKILATILDYEEGWKDLVQSMNNAAKNALPSQCYMQCSWGGKCDITKSLYHADNRACLENIETMQLWTCQYCVAENANQLQESNFVFFQELFAAVPEGTLLLVTETSPYLWPQFYRLIEAHCPSMQVGFPNKKGYQMVLRKGNFQLGDGCRLSAADLGALQQFENLSTLRERKKESGWGRQEQKIRGLVASRTMTSRLIDTTYTVAMGDLQLETG